MLLASLDRTDLTESTTIAVDAAPASIGAALRRLDLAAPLERAFTALGLAGRFALLPTRVGGPERYGMIWRIDAREAAEPIRPEQFESFSAPGYIKARWDVEVVASNAGALLSIESDLAATDDRSAARLLDAWSLIGPLSHALRERAAHALRDLVEE